MKVIKETSIKLDKESVGKIVEDYLLARGLKVGDIMFDLTITNEGAEFLGMTVTALETTEI